MSTKQDFIEVDARNTSTTIRVKIGDNNSDYYEVNLHLKYITVYNIGEKLELYYNRYLTKLTNYRNRTSARIAGEIKT